LFNYGYDKEIGTENTLIHCVQAIQRSDWLLVETVISQTTSGSCRKRSWSTRRTAESSMLFQAPASATRVCVHRAYRDILSSLDICVRSAGAGAGAVRSASTILRYEIHHLIVAENGRGGAGVPGPVEGIASRSVLSYRLLRCLQQSRQCERIL